MEFKNISFEREDRIALIKINRPKALNALNSETLKELDNILDTIAQDNNIYAIILLLNSLYVNH